jgi:hypothetical protein
MTALPNGWFDVLKHRSLADKIAVPINCAIAEPGSLTVVGDMVREGIMVWLDRQMAWAKVRHVDLPNSEWKRIEFPVDIYELTDKGIAFCDEHDIEQV